MATRSCVTSLPAVLKSSLNMTHRPVLAIFHTRYVTDQADQSHAHNGLIWLIFHRACIYTGSRHIVTHRPCAHLNMPCNKSLAAHIIITCTPPLSSRTPFLLNAHTPSFPHSILRFPYAPSDSPAYSRSFSSSFAVLNLLSFSVIAVSYILIYATARETPLMESGKNKHGKDREMGRRVTYIVGTDAACWLPIIVMGILSLSGVQIPRNVRLRSHASVLLLLCLVVLVVAAVKC